MAAGEVEKDLFQRLPIMPDLMPELLQAAQGEQAAVVDDAEPGAHPLGDLEDVRRKEHGLSLLTEVLKDVLHLARAERVEADGRLIKKENLGIVEQGRRQRYLLPHAARIRSQEVIGAVLQAEELEQRLDPPVASRALDVIEVTRKLEELTGAQLVVERGGVRHIPNPSTGFLRIGQDVDPSDPCASRRWAKQADRHLDGGRFAGPVGPQEAEGLAGSSLGIQPF